MSNYLLIFFLLSFTINAQPWFTNEQSGDLMVSGKGFNQTGGAILFNHPNGLATNGTNLIVCDRFNNRVLVWNTAPTAWNTTPDLVLGQTSFSSNNPGTSKSEMNWPGNASASSSGKLAVADTYNNRILIWNSFPTSNGQTADLSIHLPTIWASMGSPGSRWEWPWGVWTDGTKLAVTATQGSRILFWNSFPTSDNQNPDFTISHSHFGTPRNISTDGSTYFAVGDHNAKVSGDEAGTFFWNTYPSYTDQPYSFYRTGWIKGTKLPDGKFIAGGDFYIYTWYTVPTTASYNPDYTAHPAQYSNGDGPDAIYVSATNKIYVNNYNGNNVYVYSSHPAPGSPYPDFAISVSSYTLNSLNSMGYMQNPVLATDGTRLIIASDFDYKFYIYNSFPTSSGQIYDQSISTKTIDIPPWDIALHNNKFVAVGKKKVCIWNDASSLNTSPSTTYTNSIGTATFTELRGVAVDDNLFVVGDYDGKVWIWYGYPSSSSDNPDITLDYGTAKLGRLSSDGTYLSVIRQDPAGVYIYKVADLVGGSTIPFKSFTGSDPAINLPNEAITFNGSLAIANTNYSTILLWQDINDFPNTTNMKVIGQATNSSSNIPQIGQNRLFLPATLLYHNNMLWVGETKFSSRIVRFSYPTTNSTQTITAGSTSPVAFGATWVTVQFTSANSNDLQLNVSRYPFTAGGTLPSGLTNIVDFYWKVVTLSGSMDGTYSLTIDVSSVPGISDKSTLRLLRRAGIGTSWVNLGTPSSISGDNVTWSGLTSFSEFALASDDSNPLPVELTMFTAKTENGKVKLNWTTSNEVNNFGFEVERSIIFPNYRYENWHKIGFVQGNGNSNSAKFYSFIDEKPDGNKIKYRLKQIDIDGLFSYSNEVEIELDKPWKNSLYQNFPNPFNPSTKINFSLTMDSKVSLKIYNVLGQEIMNLLNGDFSAGNHEIKFDGDGMSGGVYFYKLEVKGIDGTSFNSVRKMILNK